MSCQNVADFDIFGAIISMQNDLQNQENFGRFWLLNFNPYLVSKSDGKVSSNVNGFRFCDASF